MPTVNISVLNDSDFYRGFLYQTTGGAPINIAGASMVMMLRRRATDSAVMLRLGSDTGEINIYDPVNGAFIIYISQSRLEGLGLGEFAHSLVMTHNNGLKYSIWTGVFTNNPGPSR